MCVAGPAGKRHAREEEGVLQKLVFGAGSSSGVDHEHIGSVVEITRIFPIANDKSLRVTAKIAKIFISPEVYEGRISTGKVFDSHKKMIIARCISKLVIIKQIGIVLLIYPLK